MSEKVELPLADDAEIVSVVNRFEKCTLPYEHWTHRAHLAVAVSYVYAYPFEEALQRIREQIRQYNRTCGDPEGYNETITRVFMRKIAAERRLGNRCDTVHDEVARLAKVCTVDWLYQYFTPELIWSAEAKNSWVCPDVCDLDF